MECHSGRDLTRGLKLEKGMKKDRMWVRMWHTLAYSHREGMDFLLDPKPSPHFLKNGASPAPLQMAIDFPEKLYGICGGNLVERSLGDAVRRMEYHSEHTYTVGVLDSTTHRFLCFFASFDASGQLRRVITGHALSRNNRTGGCYRHLNTRATLGLNRTC